MRSSERRADPLNRERIVDVAIELLDADGENALTLRVLAARFEAGHGTIQWHFANKSELLKAAAAAAIARATDEANPDAPPREAIHAISLEVFDTIDAHPWIGSQLARPRGSPRCCGFSS